VADDCSACRRRTTAGWGFDLQWTSSTDCLSVTNSPLSGVLGQDSLTNWAQKLAGVPQGIGSYQFDPAVALGAEDMGSIQVNHRKFDSDHCTIWNSTDYRCNSKARTMNRPGTRNSGRFPVLYGERMRRCVGTSDQIKAWVQDQYGFRPHDCWIYHCKELAGLKTHSEGQRTRERQCPGDKRPPIFRAFSHFGLLPGPWSASLPAPKASI
jgi:hypothetical protein